MREIIRSAPQAIREINFIYAYNEYSQVSLISIDFLRHVASYLIEINSTVVYAANTRIFVVAYKKFFVKETFAKNSFQHVCIFTERL